MLEDTTQQSDGHVSRQCDTNERARLLHEALITQARIILELQHEVRRLKMVEDLMEGRS